MGTGRSEERRDFFGRTYTVHYDENGKEIGRSEIRRDFFGHEYTQHQDERGTETGTSEEHRDFFGHEYTQHQDERGAETGTSEEHRDFFGRKYRQHYDASGRPIGTSERRRGFLGNKYTAHEGAVHPFRRGAQRRAPDGSSEDVNWFWSILGWIIIFLRLVRFLYYTPGRWAIEEFVLARKAGQRVSINEIGINPVPGTTATRLTLHALAIPLSVGLWYSLVLLFSVISIPQAGWAALGGVVLAAAVVLILGGGSLAYADWLAGALWPQTQMSNAFTEGRSPIGHTLTDRDTGNAVEKHVRRADTAARATQGLEAAPAQEPTPPVTRSAQARPNGWHRAPAMAVGLLAVLLLIGVGLWMAINRVAAPTVTTRVSTPGPQSGSPGRSSSASGASGATGAQGQTTPSPTSEVIGKHAHISASDLKLRTGCGIEYPQLMATRDGVERPVFLQPRDEVTITSVSYRRDEWSPWYQVQTKDKLTGCIASKQNAWVSIAADNQ